MEEECQERKTERELVLSDHHRKLREGTIYNCKIVPVQNHATMQSMREWNYRSTLS
jgi:hypothetical protein